MPNKDIFQGLNVWDYNFEKKHYIICIKDTRWNQGSFGSIYNIQVYLLYNYFNEPVEDIFN